MWLSQALHSPNLLDMGRCSPGTPRPLLWAVLFGLLCDAKTQVSQNPSMSKAEQAGATWMESRLGSHACLAFSLRTVIRRLLGWPSVAVAAAAQGCQNHYVLANSGMWAM